jgi:RTA1 like protein
MLHASRCILIRLKAINFSYKSFFDMLTFNPILTQLTIQVPFHIDDRPRILLRRDIFVFSHCGCGIWRELFRVKPRTYTIVFISCDFLSLLLRAAGGGLASSLDTESF